MPTTMQEKCFCTAPNISENFRTKKFSYSKSVGNPGSASRSVAFPVSASWDCRPLPYSAPKLRQKLHAMILLQQPFQTKMTGLPACNDSSVADQDPLQLLAAYELYGSVPEAPGGRLSGTGVSPPQSPQSARVCYAGPAWRTAMLPFTEEGRRVSVAGSASPTALDTQPMPVGE